MKIKLEKTIDVGDLGIIYLMHWEHDSADNLDSNKNYFCVYYSANFTEEASGFKMDIAHDGSVMSKSNLQMILSNYVEENINGLTDKNQMYEDPVDAVFSVFEKIYKQRKELLQ